MDIHKVLDQIDEIIYIADLENYLIFFGLMVGVRGTRGPNRFGPDPLAGEVTDPWHRNAPNPRN